MMKECLSPRSANIPSKQPPPTMKPKDKNHASPPPKIVIQPPGPDGLSGEKYTMGKELGKGGFAICYEGTLAGQKYGSRSTKFALKIVKAKMGMKKMEEKFRTELQIHSKMRHPNIVEFHRAFTFEENTYIVLELCPNGSVKDMVQRRRCLSLPEVRRYGVQLCGAIKYLHSRNVIHRDLKMGNIFLDHHMNIKLGDFGLAAILLTESDIGAVSRRTTMCGTPNYIAPEILERGRKGHDYKVDIWALGVIFFALLTGCPPFSDKVQEEIYRKVKSLDYTWPVNSRNDYPEEAKALVTSLLRTNAEERPEPDQIVGHAFFSMHGGNAIPSTIEVDNFSKKPEWLEDGSPRGDIMATATSKISIQALGEQCGVGCFSDVPFPVVGEHVGKSIYQELLHEESVGRAPSVPMPEDFVYTSIVSPIITKIAKPESVVPRRPASMRIPNSRSKMSVTAVAIDVDEPKKAGPQRTLPSRTASSMRLPNVRTRPAIKLVSADPDLPERPLSHRAISTRSETSTRVASRSANSSTTAVCSEAPALNHIPAIRTSSNRSQTSVPSNSDPISKPLGPPPALIGPHDISECVPGSKITELVAVLEQFHANLTTCLDSIGSKPSTTSASSAAPPVRPTNIPARPHVVKWVDYTNKFGIGYILANGSIGCVFNGTPTRASTCIVVPGADEHLRQRSLPEHKNTYVERHQIVPRSGANITFLENRADAGLQRINVPATRFEVNVGKNGQPDKLAPVPDTYENERRRMVSLWDKFARYMTQTLGGDPKPADRATSAHPLSPSSAPSAAAAAEHFVTFYQRLGNVGVWAFASGAVQFNFPDHTKLVLHPHSTAAGGGCWADFYHLSPAAAALLQRGKVLPAVALEARGVLSMSLAEMLLPNRWEVDARGRTRLVGCKDVVDANELVAKVRFVRDVVAAWVRGGGLGRGCGAGAGAGGDGARRVRWEGLKEEGGGRERSVWVTVGMAGGDVRFEEDK